MPENPIAEGPTGFVDVEQACIDEAYARVREWADSYGVGGYRPLDIAALRLLLDHFAANTLDR